MLKTSLRLTWRGLNHLTRIALVVAVLLTLIGGALILSLRYWILPDIERYHDVIASSFSQAIGQPVSIGKIEADWRGMRPHLMLEDVRILEKNKPGVTVLALQHVDGVVGWLTLLRGEMRLHSLEFEQPDLLIRRDAQGLLHIAGVALSGQSSDQNGLADWLLHQTYLVVRNARITWLDEQHAAPALVFNQLNLLIENRGRHHRFALRALPPAELSSQLDVRGDFSGRSFYDLDAWRGQLYTQLNYADMVAWRTWLPLPAEIKRGRGAMRGWLSVVHGKVNQVTADLALADVQAQLAEGASPLDLHTLHGRIGWMESAQGIEVSTNQLSLLAEGVALPPTDFYLRLAQASDKQPASGEIRASTLELSHIVTLADALPLGKDLKKKLAELAPQGTVSNLQAKWQGDADKPIHYEVKAKFDQLSLKRTDKLPGFSGLSGELNGSDITGMLSLNAHNLTLDAPQIMPEPVAFNTFSGQGTWQSKKQGMEVKFSNISAANADIAGTVFGSFQTLPNSPGLIDLNINLTHAALNHADRYIPLNAIDKDTHAWLRKALLDGSAEEFHLRLQGDLNDFPFPENKKGIFQLQAHIREGALEYAKDWPKIDNITGDFMMQGKRLELNASSGMTVGAHLQKIRVTMQDTASPDLMLQIRGEVAGETSHSLDFIQQSPVHGYIDGATDDMTAHGNGNLQLALNIPLRGDKPTTVSGDYHFIDNDINLGNGVPVLYSTNGDLFFTESTIRTKNVSTKILGGPATLSVQSGADGIVQAKVHGRADMDALRKIEAHPLLSRLHGGSDWDAQVTMQKGLSTVLVTSNLSGLVSDLPEPFAKEGDEIIPLRFEVKSIVANQDIISLQYGNLLNVRMLRRDEDGDMVIKRGTVNFGGAGKWLNRDGIWITGTLPQLSLQGWGGLTPPVEGTASKFSIAGADLTIQKLDAYGLSMNGLHVNARNREGVLTAQMTGKEMNGEVSWQSEGKGKLVARLKNLNLALAGSGKSDDSAKKKEAVRKLVTDDDVTRTEYPALDLAVDELTWNEKHLGKMELLARQHGSEWLLEQVRLTNSEGVLSAEGKYNTTEAKPQTQVNLKLEINNAGKILARSGYPNSVKNGSGKLEGDLSWRGAPDDFSYATLDGKVKLDASNGQFLKIDPGAGKLLSILSLQALPSHITLDFTDVFSQGFAFDSITGTGQIKRGVLETNDFRINGSSAKVTMLGQIDLDHETQNLRVRILPTVGNSVSLLGFAAGPLVGVGTFIVNKVLREPLDKLVSFEYNVTGTWVNPNVTKVVKPTAGLAGKESNP